MRVLIALTYYRPHVSGVTVYAERLARGLARRGHEVTVLTSRYAPWLEAREDVDGVHVVRVPVWRKVSKGVIMPLFPAYAAAFLRRNDVVNVHMPQFEAALLGGLGRAFGRPVIVTYHCDLQLPHGLFNRLVDAALKPLNHVAALCADAVVVTSTDYADSSPFLRRYASRLRAISPLIESGEPDASYRKRLLEEWNLDGSVRIGFAARFAAEKGVEYLLRALPRVLEAYPNARVVFTGAYKDTVGEEDYWRRIQAMLPPLRDHLTFLDLIPPRHMPAYFSTCDVLAVTSVNSTEAFGLVQAEAMLAGTPVVATDLPGIREAVRRTGMGLVVPPRDPDALARALIEVIANRPKYQRPHASVAAEFDLDRALREYEELFERSRDRSDAR